MFTIHSRLAEIVTSDIYVIPMLQRFGFTLGVGDEPIDEQCRKLCIDAHFFTQILNVYSQRISPKKASPLSECGIRRAIDYLAISDRYFASTSLANIERHFRALHDKSDNADNNLEFLWRFFQEVKSELLGSVDYDGETLFKAILNFIDPSAESYSSEEENAALAKSLACAQEKDDSIEEKLNDLKTFFLIHLRGDYDQNLCMAVVTSLTVFETDILRNNCVRRFVADSVEKLMR